MIRQDSRSGFTIVELLIVIVVIAILAAITIVAYNGIRQSAELSALKSDLSQQMKNMAAYRVTNNETYPATLAAARTAGMFQDGARTQFVAYLTSPDNTQYCASGQNGSSGPYWSVTSRASAPVPGLCVENLIRNPSFETGIGLWALGGAVPVVNRVAGGEMGEFRIAMSRAAPVSDAQFNMTGPLESNVEYSVAYWASSTSPTCYMSNQFSRNVVGYSPFANVAETKTSTPTIYRATGTSPSNTSQYRWRITPCADGNGTVYYDGFTAVRASFPLKTPYDGDSEGWFWTGTPHASTSIGPAEPL